MDGMEEVGWLLEKMKEYGIFPLIVWIIVAFRKAFSQWLDEQKERTQAEVKLEVKLGELTEGIKTLASSGWDLKRHVDLRLDTLEDLNRRIEQSMDTLIKFIPKRKSDQGGI